MYERYARQIVLRGFGFEGQERLRRAKVCIVGLGGLGSVASLYLAAMGVGYLRIVDKDVVEKVNLHRQILYDDSMVGKPKAKVAEARLRKLNPEVKVEGLNLEVEEENAEKILEDVDLVVDGLDNFKTRYLVNRTCFKLKKPYVYASVLESYGSVSVFKPGETGCLECVFRDVRDEDLPACEKVGILPPAVGAVASIEVSEAVKLILGWKPNLQGRLAFIDLSSLSFHLFDLPKDPRCPVCGRL